MSSSMLSGERRWASSRRGGMTVLGKVAVPKPINLPSQRLENLGLDPNVEIVPKGTLSWGSRPSSSASNAWGSSSLSPNTDGSSSPSRLSARPSSGGSGTRPSTAGSDRALEPTTNAGESNSRPSSASGTLTSNQTSLTSLRPRSAETRSGSSQLSRFAEHTTENSVGWSAARTTENLGVTQPKNDEFSLSSGDFPSLGSEKDKSVLNFELQDHCSNACPGSSSGLGNDKNETSLVDDAPLNANVKGGTVNSCRRDYQAYSEDSVRPGIEKWQGSPQLYHNPAFPPQHFDAWHGLPPVNNPQGGVWFRGSPNGPPFGNPAASGGFPIEPFPYYRPHIPPTGLANPPPIPPSGTGPRGHHKNGDVYRPHMLDACIRPGMPIRPRFYPGPMAYEAYYNPPMGYCNSNEREVPFMGMPGGPAVYNRYSNQNPSEPGNSQCRSSGYGSAGKPLASEQSESNHLPDTAGPYRVLLKQHNEWDGTDEQTNWEDSETTNASYVDGRDQSRLPGWERENRSNFRNKEKDLRTSAHGEEGTSRTSENQGSTSVKAKPPESTRSIKKFDDISGRKLDGVASNAPEAPSRPSVPKDSSLIQKIEGLNAKARDNSSAKSKEKQRSKFHTGSAPVNHMENEVSAGVVFPESTYATEIINPSPREVGAFGREKNFDSLSFNGMAGSRQTAHGMQGRGDHCNNGRLNNQDADGWRKKFVVADSLTPSGAQLEASSVLVGDHQISVDAYDRSGSYNQAKCDEDSTQTMSDPTDSHAQHAKMKKLSKQRTKQLQEEEEQTRKQKSEALVKLDESNRHSQAVEGSAQKEHATNATLQNKQEELQSSGSATVSGKSVAVNSAVLCNANVVCQISDAIINKVEESSGLSSEPPLETLKNTGKEPVLSHNQSVTMHQDVNSDDATNALQVQKNIASNQKRMGYKQKQNLPLDKTLNEKVVSTTSTAPKVENDIVVDVTVPSGIATNEVGSVCGSGLPMNSTAMVESSVNQKRKNNRNGKNKHKVEETSSSAMLSTAIPKEAILAKSSVESDKPKASDFELDKGSLQPASLSKDSNQYSEQWKYLANEESQARMNSQWKSQHSRRMPRNMQATRTAEKSHGNDAVVWAPVKPQNKTETVDESSEKSKTEVVNPVKSDQQVHNLKNKRAEMERYIPKPAAKEMAQQGSIQVASSMSQASTEESAGRVDSGSRMPQFALHTNSAVGKAGFRMESKNGDGRQTKQGKAHGSWWQRNPTESTNVLDMQDGLNHDLNTDQNVQIPAERQQSQKSETSLLKGQTKHFIDSSEPNVSNNPVNHDSATLVSVPAVKDHTATSRGRRVPFRGHKDIGVNNDVDHKKNAGETEKNETLYSSSEHSQPDIGAAFKEDRGVGERLRSCWQPKYQASNNQRANRPNDQNVGSVGVRNKNDSTPHGKASLPVGRDKESKALVAQPHHDQSVSEKIESGYAQNFRNQESKREGRNVPPKDRPNSPNQVTVTLSEQAPSNMDLRHERCPSSVFRKNGNPNRFGRRHDTRGDWKPSGQDNRHYSQPTNRERQGPKLHYEYHTVGSYDDSKSDNSGRPKEGNHVRGRNRERGQTHSRRGGGNFEGS